MKKIFTLYFVVLFFLYLPNHSFSRPQDVSFSNGLKIKPGAHVEYFSRVMTWDENQQSSKLKSYIFALSIELEINEGFSISALAGYTLSNYDSIVFRQLPFSVELDVGEVGGFILGAEAKKALFNADAFEFGIYGQFLYHIGKEKNWDIPGLSVTGTLTGKPTWMRAVVGPYISFTNLGAFTPYLSARYNNLWGKFEMRQAIQTLTGTEEKDLQSKGVIDVTLGSLISPTDNFFLSGEVHLLPHSDGMDLGFVAIAAFSF